MKLQKQQKKTESVISEENAMAEVYEYLDDYRIIIEDFGKEERPAYEGAIKKIIRGVMDGVIRFETHENGDKYFTQKLSNGEILEYKNQKSVAKMAMAKAGEDANQRLHYFAMSMCNMPASFTIPNRDESLAGSIALILFS